jgi:copper resistance protein D
MTASLALRVVHVVGALVWVGGMLFVALVLVPVARHLADADLRRRLITAIGVRFRTVGWVAVGLVILSGLGNLWLRPELLATPACRRLCPPRRPRRDLSRESALRLAS